MPERITLSRARGWRMPEGARKVDRTGPNGNPFPGPQSVAVECHRRWLAGEGPDEIRCGARTFSRSWVLEHIGDLVGRDLACWCKTGPCHAETLLALAAAHAEASQFTERLAGLASAPGYTQQQVDELKASVVALAAEVGKENAR